MRVVAGIAYLQSITPDSLKNKITNWNEIFVEKRISSDLDPMGVDCYLIKGKVIGGQSMGNEKVTYPISRIETSKFLSPILKIILIVILSLQVICFIIFFKK